MDGCGQVAINRVVRPCSGIRVHDVLLSGNDDECIANEVQAWRGRVLASVACLTGDNGREDVRALWSADIVGLARGAVCDEEAAGTAASAG